MWNVEYCAPVGSNRHCTACTAVTRLMPAFMLRVSKKGDGHPYKGDAVHLVQLHKGIKLPRMPHITNYK